MAQGKSDQDAKDKMTKGMAEAGKDPKKSTDKGAAAGHTDKVAKEMGKSGEKGAGKGGGAH